MVRNRWALVACGTLALVAAGRAAAAEESKAGPAASPHKEATFELREVSAFGREATASSRHAYMLVRGQSVECGTEPDKQVKVYPKLKSKQPLYGKVRFGATRADPNAGTEYHFVIDESGEKPVAAQPPDSPPAEPKSGEKPAERSAGKKSGDKSSLLKALASSLLGDTAASSPLRPLVRPPEKTPITYDRLHFDANRDLDLTNDPILAPMKDPPAEAERYSSGSKQTVIYDYLAIPFDYGPGLGVRPFRLLPRLMIQEYEGKQYRSLSFVATAARTGRIRIGTRECDVVLAQPYLIVGRFDGPGTAMYVIPRDSRQQPESWWGSEQVGAMRRVDGTYYTASVTPAGDKLTVKPYQGDFGTFKLGAAKRDLKRLSMSGSLSSKTSAVAVGDPDNPRRLDAEATTECSIPVGDYLPAYLNIEYGRLALSLSDNYHSDGRPRDVQERQRRYAFLVRKDRPFVLDFSNKPEIMFASPAKDQTLKRGDTLRVAAVLTDPVLGIMIRRLDDTGRKQKEVFKLPDGKEHSYERSLSLDPKVTITNSSGKQVAEGKLPFG